MWRLRKRLIRKPWALLFGLLLLVTDIVFLDENSLILLALAIAAIGKGGYDIIEPAIKDSRRLRGLYRSKREGGPREYDYEGLGYQGWTKIARGTEIAIHDPVLDARLSQDDPVAVTVEKEIWFPASSAAEEVRKLLALRLDFDEVKIRPMSEILTETSTVRLQRTRYSASLVTNNLATFQINRSHDDRDMLPFSRIGLTNGQISRFAASGLSNHFGADVLVIADDRIVLQRNSENNYINPGMVISSGSGSADWADTKGRSDLCSIVKQTMRRELCEELGIAKRDEPGDADIRIIGYARLTHMGGKPQFYGVTRVHNVTPRIAASERRYVADHLQIPFDPAGGSAGVVAALDQVLATYGPQDDVAFALYVNIAMLKQWLATSDQAESWLLWT